MKNSRFAFPASFPPFPPMLQPFQRLILWGELPPTPTACRSPGPSQALLMLGACTPAPAIGAHSYFCKRTVPIHLQVAYGHPLTARTQASACDRHCHDPQSLKPGPLQKCLPAPDLTSIVLPDYPQNSYPSLLSWHPRCPWYLLL